MLKIDIRKKFKHLRQAITSAEKNKLEDLILIQFQRSGINIPTNIMTYAAAQSLHEVDPALIERYCKFLHPSVQFYYPVLDNHNMYPSLTHEQTNFEVNSFGIEEPVNGILSHPSDVDLIIIPLLAVDRQGNRVGFGKGYYDRFLQSCREDCITVGLSFFEPIDQVDDVEAFDIPIDYAVTPNQCYSFT